MKCLYCGNLSIGKFCSNCGKELIKEFSTKNFSKIQAELFEGGQAETFKHLSANFSKEVSITGIPQSPKTLYKDFQRWGYLFRIAEERFGVSQKINDKEFLEILHKGEFSHSENIKAATDYLDSKGTTISLDGINKEYIIVPEIAGTFAAYFSQNIDNIIHLGRSGKLSFSINKDADLETLKEILFRNAVWGYFYKVAEGQLNVKTKSPTNEINNHDSSQEAPPIKIQTTEKPCTKNCGRPAGNPSYGGFCNPCYSNGLLGKTVKLAEQNKQNSKAVEGAKNTLQIVFGVIALLWFLVMLPAQEDFGGIVVGWFIIGVIYLFFRFINT